MHKKFFLIIFSLFLFSFLPLEEKQVFVIGDSISMQYGPYLHQYLGKGYTYDRLRKSGTPFSRPDSIPLANGQDSRNVLKNIQRLLNAGSFKPDLLLLNCGLHDIKTHPETQTQQVPIQEYRANLETVFTRLKEADIPVMWVRTTPVVDSIHNTDNMKFHRYAQTLSQYNEIADMLCKTHHVPQIDLHTFTENIGGQHFVDHVHFDPEVRKLQAAYIAGRVHQELNAP